MSFINPLTGKPPVDVIRIRRIPRQIRCDNCNSILNSNNECPYGCR